MTVAERINQFLTEKRPEEICDGCIAEALDLRHQQVNQVTLALGTTSDFDRGYGLCSICRGYSPLGGDVEMVTRRA